MALPRFDGAAAWAELTAEQQAAIGAVTLEMVVSWHGGDGLVFGTTPPREIRMWEHACSILCDRCSAAVEDAIPGTVLRAEQLPFPASLGKVCRECGCTDHDACEGGCRWVEEDLCSRCRDGGGKGGRR